MESKTRRSVIFFAIMCGTILILAIYLLWPAPPAYTVRVRNWARNADGSVTTQEMDIPIYGLTTKQKDRFLDLKTTGQATWFMDEVIPDPNVPLKFRFRGISSVTVDEISPEVQTSIANITANPAYYAQGGAGGYPLWAINITVVDVF